MAMDRETMGYTAPQRLSANDSWGAMECKLYLCARRIIGSVNTNHYQEKYEAIEDPENHTSSNYWCRQLDLFGYPVWSRNECSTAGT